MEKTKTEKKYVLQGYYEGDDTPQYVSHTFMLYRLDHDPDEPTKDIAPPILLPDITMANVWNFEDYAKGWTYELEGKSDPWVGGAKIKNLTTKEITVRTTYIY